MKDFGKFYGHFVNFTAVYFMIICGHFGIFSRFGMLYKEKSGNPAAPSRARNRALMSCPFLRVRVRVCVNAYKIIFSTLNKRIFCPFYTVQIPRVIFNNFFGRGDIYL
jgi:hypothetical protein